MTWIDYSIIALYLIGLLAMGVSFRNQPTSKDYFLGGRTIPWPALALSVMATQLSAISFISAPAFVGLREGGGLIWLSYELALPLAVLLMMWRLLPTLHQSGVVSVYDFLERRFERSTRLLISFVFQLSRSFATAIMIYAISLILQGTMGMAQWQSIVLIGVITLIYSAVGGMKAVVFGDAVQMVLILAGAIICLVVALGAMGGIDATLAALDTNRLNAINLESLGLQGNDFGLLPMLFGGVVLYASYYGCDQSEAQRSLSAHNVSDLRKVMYTVALSRFPITLIYCCAGLVIGTLVMQTPELQAQIPDNKPDWMMPVFIVNYLPSGLIGLLVVAIMAAAMSSLSSAINSLAAVTTEDICRVKGHELSDEQYMRFAKRAGVGWGLVTLILSFFAGDIAPTIIEAINKIGSVFYGPVLATFLLGIHSKRITAKAANIGLLLGVFSNTFLWLSDNPLFWFWWNFIGFVVAILSAHLANRLIPSSNKPKPQRAFSGITPTLATTLFVWCTLLVVVCSLLPDWLV